MSVIDAELPGGRSASLAGEKKKVFPGSDIHEAASLAGARVPRRRIASAPVLGRSTANQLSVSLRSAACRAW